MKILVLANKNTGCDYHRLLLPFSYIELKDGDSFRIIFNDETVYKHDFDVDIVIFNRIPHVEINHLLDLQNKYKFKIVVDIDDYWILNSEHPMFLDWVTNKQQEKLEKSIRVADLVTTTNQQLKDKISDINPHVEILPNGLPIGYDQFNYKKSKSNIIRVGFIGGNTHLNDISSISNVFKRLESNKLWLERGRFILFGVSYTKSGVWQDIEKIIKPCRNYSKVSALPLQSYMRCYDITDVSIAPLIDNNFNKYKSTLKIVESGCKKVPIITSAVLPYTEDISAPGVTMCNNEEQWLEAIDRFITHPEDIQEEGEKLYKYVNNKYNLLDINKKRINLIHQL